MTGYLASFPSFLAYFSLGIAAFAAFFVVYILVTPHREVALIRAGNVSASLCLAGAMLGFAFPVASAISHSVALVDLALWSVAALTVQIVAYGAMLLLVRDLTAQIEADRISVAIVVATAFVSIGLLNAAAMTY